MSLYRAFLDNDGPAIHKWDHYFPIYERYFAPFRNRSILFVEIGTAHGGSAQMWKRYFGPLAKIVTLDLSPECKGLGDNQVSVRIGDQSDPSFLHAVLEEFGSPDIVLDDGSHRAADIRISFETLYPKMSREAVYLVEDVHTSYWPEYGGGYLVPESFMEYAKRLADGLNARFSRGAITTNPAFETMRGVHFYDSVIVFEKGPFATRDQRLIPSTAEVGDAPAWLHEGR